MAAIYWPFPLSTVSEWPGTRPAGWGYHVGTDFAVPQGTALRATMAGTIDIHWTDGLGAWVIDIINPDGTVVRNGHLSYMAVGDGDWVNAGDYIGNTGGASGTPGAGLSTGPHLHWEIRSNRNWNGPGWYDPRHLNILSFGQSVPSPTQTTVTNRKKRTSKMLFIYLEGSTTYAIYSPGVKGSWTEAILTQGSANQLASQHGNAMMVGIDFWNAQKKKHS